MGIPGALLSIAFWSVIVPVCLSVAMVLFSEFFYTIGVLLFTIMDALQSVFRKLAGLGTVWMASSTGGDPNKVDGDILVVLLKNPTIVDTLISVTVFAVALTIIATIVQMIRVEYTTEGSKNSKEGIIGLGLKSLVMFVLIPVVCFFGIRLSNYLLKAVDAATSSSNTSSLAGSVFNAATVNANRISNSIEGKVSIGDINIGGLLAYVGGDSTGNHHAVLGGEKGKYYILHFEDTLKSTQTEATRARMEIGKQIDALMAMGSEGAKQIGKDGYGKGINVAGGDMNYKNISAVCYFYSTGDINYIILYFGAYLVLKTLFDATMGLVVRMYKVAALFVIVPATIGLQPIDGGNAFKTWKKSFISNVVSAYSVVVAFNLFFILVGVITQIELWDPLKWNNYLQNKFMQALFAVIGITQIKALIKDIGGFIGSADILTDGAGAVGEAKGAISSVTKVGVGMGVGAIAIKNGIGGALKNAKVKRNEKNADREKWETNKGNDKIAAAQAKFFKDEDGNYHSRKTGKKVSFEKNERLKEKVKNLEIKRDDAARKGRDWNAANTGKTAKAKEFNQFSSAIYANRAAEQLASSAAGFNVARSTFEDTTLAKNMMGMSFGDSLKNAASGKMFKEYNDAFEKDTGLKGKPSGISKILNKVDGLTEVGDNALVNSSKNNTQKSDTRKALKDNFDETLKTLNTQKSNLNDAKDGITSNVAGGVFAGRSMVVNGLDSEPEKQKKRGDKAAFELLNLSLNGNLDVNNIKSQAVTAMNGQDYNPLSSYGSALNALSSATDGNVASLLDAFKREFNKMYGDDETKEAIKDIDVKSANIDEAKAKVKDEYNNASGGAARDALGDFAKGVKDILNGSGLKLDTTTIKSLLDNAVIKTKEEGESKFNIDYDKLKSTINEVLKSKEDAIKASEQAKATAQQTKLLQDMLKELKKKK